MAARKKKRSAARKKKPAARKKPARKRPASKKGGPEAEVEGGEVEAPKRVARRSARLRKKRAAAKKRGPRSASSARRKTGESTWRMIRCARWPGASRRVAWADRTPAGARLASCPSVSGYAPRSPHPGPSAGNPLTT